MFFPAVRMLSEPLLASVQARAGSVTARENDILFNAEIACPGFVMVTNGTVAAYQMFGPERRMIVCRVQAGEACAVTAGAMIGQRIEAISAVAETDVAGVCFPQPLFLELLDQSYAFRSFVLSILAQRLGESLTLARRLAFGGLEQRLAAALVQRGYPIEASHRELADELGSAREQISRILKDLEQRKIVQLGRRSIYILDEHKLRQIADAGDDPHRCVTSTEKPESTGASGVEGHSGLRTV